MKFVTVVTSVDSNPDYTYYIKPFIEFWLEQNKLQDDFIFRPLIQCINFSPKVPDSQMHYVETVKIESNFTNRSMSQLFRILVAKDIESDFVIPTDIDMLPLSVEPFRKALSFITHPESQLVVMRDVLEVGQYPICYNVCAPKIWKDLFSDKFEVASIKQLLYIFDQRYGEQAHGWYFDQELIYQLFTGQNRIEIILSDDSATGLKRLDRQSHKFPKNWLKLRAISKGRFTEYHAPRRSILTTAYLKVLLMMLRKTK